MLQYLKLNQYYYVTLIFSVFRLVAGRCLYKYICTHTIKSASNKTMSSKIGRYRTLLLQLACNTMCSAVYPGVTNCANGFYFEFDVLEM